MSTSTQAREADAGISLAELIVTIMLIGIVTAVATGAFATMSKVTATAQTLDLDIREASNAMNQVARTIRAGARNPIPSSAIADPAVLDGTASSVTLYAYVNFDSTDTRPIEVTFQTTAQNQLIESTIVGTQDPDGYWQFTTEPTTRTLAGNIRAHGANPMFGYLDRNGSELPVEDDGSLSETSRRQVMAITINLVVDAVGDADKRAGITLQNTAHLSNVDNARS